MPDTAAFRTFQIAGINVAAIDLPLATDLLGKLATAGGPSYITVTGAHGVVESAYDARIREAHRQAKIVVPDGMPLVWLGRLLGFKAMGRVYGPDFMESVFARAEYRQLRHFFYGSSPAQIARLKDVLNARFGSFELVGEYSPPMRPADFEEADEVLARIRELKPDVIWVSLSTPKQELWLQRHMPKIGSGVGVGVGAAFDLISGATTQAPKWIQRSGLEWLFRLSMEPGRLYRRYAFVVPRFFYFFFLALLNKGHGR
jgi:N-acetylglucosaminyldiphosphoundecaprenol N-acetyl-beta-D-mannosaminyltransferase